VNHHRMLAFCGLVCTECPAYLATQDNDITKAQKVADEWSTTYHAQIKTEHVWCDGCLVEGKKCAHCSQCEIRACGIEHKVNNCGLCTEYPCEKIEAFFKMAPAARTHLDAQKA